MACRKLHHVRNRLTLNLIPTRCNMHNRPTCPRWRSASCGRRGSTAATTSTPSRRSSIQGRSTCERLLAQLYSRTSAVGLYSRTIAADWPKRSTTQARSWAPACTAVQLQGTGKAVQLQPTRPDAAPPTSARPVSAPSIGVHLSSPCSCATSLPDPLVSRSFHTATRLPSTLWKEGTATRLGVSYGKVQHTGKTTPTPFRQHPLSTL